MMDDCGDHKATYFGWSAYCILPPGHDGEHQSADFIWLDEDNRARPKPHAQPEVRA